MSKKWRIASAALVGSMLLASSGGCEGPECRPEEGHARPQVGGPAGVRPRRDPLRRRHPGRRRLRHRHRRPDARSRAGRSRSRTSTRRSPPCSAPPAAGHDQRPGGQPRLGYGLPVGLPRPGPGRHAGHPPRRHRRQAARVALEDVKFAKAELPNPVSTEAKCAARASAASRSPTSPSSTAALRRRPVQRGVRLEAAAIPFPFEDRRGGRHRDLPRRPRPVRDALAGADLRPLRDQRRAAPAGRLHLHAAGEDPGLRAKRAPTSRGRPSPSWATATARST